MIVTTDEGLMLPVIEVSHGDLVRPSGWFYFTESIGVENMGDGWIKVLWKMDANAPGPYTMFQVNEYVEVHW